MKFNIFADIFHGAQGELAPTFSGKFVDTFLVMTGTNKRFGLFDYFTLFTPSFFSSLKGLSELIFSVPILGILLSPILIPTYIISKFIFIVLILIRFLTSYIASLLLLPVITLVHLISVLAKKDLSNSFEEKIADMFIFINGEDKDPGFFSTQTKPVNVEEDEADERVKLIPY
jgi:hypothetical protein